MSGYSCPEGADILRLLNSATKDHPSYGGPNSKIHLFYRIEFRFQNCSICLWTLLVRSGAAIVLRAERLRMCGEFQTKALAVFGIVFEHPNVGFEVRENHSGIVLMIESPHIIYAISVPGISGCG